MMAQAMVWIAATAVLLGLAACAAGEVLRSYGRQTRWVWVIALCGSAGFPIAALATDGAFPGSLLPSARESLDIAQLLASADAGIVETQVLGVSANGRGERFDRVLGIAWPAASLLALLVYAATWLRLARSRRRWRSSRIDDTPVLLSARGGPAVLGLIRPSIVVPEWLRAEPAEAQRMVLLHEREHLRARDHALLAIAPLFAIAMPWNPALWWQLRRLRLAIELDCDRRVLARGVGPDAYGALLLDIARRGGPTLGGAAALAEPRSFLERRILAMSSTIPRLRLPRAVLLSAVAAALILAACESTMPMNVNTPAPQTAEPEVAAAVEQPVSIAPEGFFATPLYVVDGVIVSAKVEELVDPEDIDSIEVIKGAAATGLYGLRGANGVINITTKGGGEAIELEPETRAAVVERPIELVPVPASEQPLIIVDGVIVEIEVSEVNDMKNIDRIEVVKGEAAARLYGPRGENGVISIVTKGGGEKIELVKVRGRKLLEARGSAGIVKLRERPLAPRSGPVPIIMIDGVIVGQADLDRLSPRDIDSIEVVKGDAAAALGITGGGGIIRIYTKR